MKVLVILVLIGSAYNKVVLQNEEYHVSNEIRNDDKPLAVSTTASPQDVTTLTTKAPTSKDTSENEIDHEHNTTLDNDITSNVENVETTTLPTSPTTPVDNGTALILTPYVKEGRIEEARNASRVDPELFLGFESYSGFVTVNETYNSNLFFWYFPAPNKPVNETPWILWLQGGPGASSLTGLFDEIGPVNFSPFGTLKKNPHTWLSDHSLLFIDNPVGTGYSFTDSKEGFAVDLDTYATHLYVAMKQFIQIFPELQNAPLFVAGESYAGKYVPALAMRIHRQKEWPGGHFNLQGLMLGNALVDPEVISHIALPFQYFGLIDQTQINSMQPLIDGFQSDIANNRSVDAKLKWMHIISNLLYFSSQSHAYNFLRDDLNVGKYSAYLARSDVKRALHVGDIRFSFLNFTVNSKLAPDFLSNTTPLMEELLENYRVLVYCGQLDQMLPCMQTSQNYRTWSWNGTQEFLAARRSPYYHNHRLAGYHKTGGRLTEAMFRGAGHMVPLDAPAPARALVARWARGEPLDKPATFNRDHLFSINDTVVNF